jgi:hypothetical protein
MLYTLCKKNIFCFSVTLTIHDLTDDLTFHNLYNPTTDFIFESKTDLITDLDTEVVVSLQGVSHLLLFPFNRGPALASESSSTRDPFTMRLCDFRFFSTHEITKTR